MANHISVNEYYITIAADGNDAGLLALMPTVPLFSMRKRGVYRCSLKYLPEVLQILRGISSTDQLRGTVKKLYDEELRRRYYTPLLKKDGPNHTSDFLWPQQQLGVELAEVNRRYGFFYDTRTGKTPMSLQIMYNALKAGKAKRCIVVCPSSIIEAWLEDAAKFFPQLKVAAYYGTEKQKDKALSMPSHIVVWSMEQFVDCFDWLSQIHFDMCFVDESSKLKSHRTKISNAMRKFSLMVSSWYLLSATPAPNNHSEYYTQMMTIDPYIFNPARTKFVSKYFDNMSRNYSYEKLTIKPNMYDIFMQQIEERAIYVDQSVMPTAGKEWKVVTYELPAYAKDVYNEMRTKMWTEVIGKEITVDMAAIMRAKLNQITSGFIMDTEAIKENKLCRKLGKPATQQEVLPLIDNGDYSRIAQLDKLLKKLGDQKIVIWANYAEEFRMIEKLLGDKARYIRGGCTVDEKEQYISEFKGGPLQYLVCHPASLGYGRNLTEAHIAIYYSLNDSWELFKQSSERIVGHIKVQPHKCIYYVLLAADTVNELIYDNLTNKRDASFAFMDHLRAEALR